MGFFSSDPRRFNVGVTQCYIFVDHNWESALHIINKVMPSLLQAVLWDEANIRKPTHYYEQNVTATVNVLYPRAL